MLKKPLIACIALVMLSLATPAVAGPPFVCHPFEIGTSASLPWKTGDWLGMRSDYDVTRVVEDTEALLTPDMPTLARMETLRRAVLYASRDRAQAERLIAALTARVHGAEGDGRANALALFDAGYVIEAMTEIEMMGHHMSDLADRGRTLAGLTRPFDGQALILKSAALRPDDATIAFALALVSEAAATRQPHLAKARAGARHDRLLASTMARLHMLQ